MRERRKTLATIGLAQVRVEEQRRELSSIDARVDELLQEVTSDLDDEDLLREIRSAGTALLRERRELLNQSASSYQTYIRVLGELDSAQTALIETANQYRDFLDENLLWIPNTRPITGATIRDLPAAAAWLFSPAAWMATAAAFFDAIDERRAEAFLALVLLLVSVVMQPTLKRRFQILSSRVGRLSTDSIFVTLRSLAIAAIQALPVPLALAIVGLALPRSPSPTAFTQSASAAFLTAAPFLYNLLLFRVLSARKGVLNRHFNWREENLAMIRRQLDRLILIGVPIVLITVMLFTSEVREYRDSLGRVAFIALMLLFCAAAWPLGHPRKSVGANYYDRHAGSWLSRLKWLWFALDVGLPASLALLATIGFMYTAAVLTGKLVDTFWLVLGLTLASLVIRRWLALSRRGRFDDVARIPLDEDDEPGGDDADAIADENERLKPLPRWLSAFAPRNRPWYQPGL